MNRHTVQRYYGFKLVFASLFIGIVASFLAFSLKQITEFSQEHIFSLAERKGSLWFFFLPTIGITGIYFLRKYLFKNRKNKGITEIYDTLGQRRDHLPFFKIPSHYINGFMTVIFGGSTGIEVSTVVATATVGNAVYKQQFAAKAYKQELVSAGVVAGIGVLFGNPLVGVLFVLEVIARKTSRALLVSSMVAGIVAWVFLACFRPRPLIMLSITDWHWRAVPFMVLLSLLCGVLSAYFTALVIRIKTFFSRIHNNFIRVNLGALVVGALIFFFPFLYGDSYHSLNQLLSNPRSCSVLFLFMLVLLKPLASSLTLGAGGDGGVFAPSIVTGAYLGLAFSMACNMLFGTSLIPVNFMLIGIAATLSASIFAPFTALVLACSMIPHGYVLFLPVLLGCIVSKTMAQKILPYNVYTYKHK
ncbi:MAG: chloride channel protein [Chitinophagaceae bacterium]